MPALVTETTYGPMLVPPHDQYIGHALREYGAYCPEELAVWLQYVPEGGTVIDVGANLGSHTMGFADKVGPTGSVLALEPQRPIFNMLCGSSALTGRSWIDARNVAAGRTLRTDTIARLDYDQPNNFGGLALGAYPTRAVYDTVVVEPLDSFRLTRCDLIKIDVEGMELDVLKGAMKTISKCAPVIVAEANELAVVDWLADRGYTLYHQATPLGDAWPGVGSFNYLAIPAGTAEPVSPRIERLAVVA
jgi:FkbM family methyltransferase